MVSLGDNDYGSHNDDHDDDNTPPWDSWLLFVEETPRSPDRWTAFDSYLLCWIPQSLVPMVDRAIEVNPEQCLRWADDLRAPFLEHLFHNHSR